MADSCDRENEPPGSIQVGNFLWTSSANSSYCKRDSESLRYTGWSKSLCALDSVYSNNPHTTDDLKMAITEHIRTVDRAILNTVFENTFRRVNECLETDEGHFEPYL